MNPLENLGKLIAKLWAPFAGLLGAITVIVQFIQLWRGDQETVTLVLSVSGAILLLISFYQLGFSLESSPIVISSKWGALTTKKSYKYGEKVSKIARLGIIAYCVIIIIAGISIYQHNKWLEKQLIILVGNFSGPDSDSFRVNEIILSNLRIGLSSETSVLIIPLGKVITEQGGSEMARNIGRNYQADLVIWGWYGVTESDVLITVHIENLGDETNSQLPEPKNDTLIYKDVASKINSFEIQQQLSSELAGLILMIKGLVAKEYGEYAEAREIFERAIETWGGSLIGNEYLYYLRGSAYLELYPIDCNKAIADFSRFLSVRPEGNASDIVYQLRGMCHLMHEDFEFALEDLNVAIQLNPTDSFFLLRAQCYFALEDYTSSLNDLEKWEEYLGKNEINNNNDLENAANVVFTKYIAEDLRGRNYEALGEYEEAVQHYSVIDEGISGIGTISTRFRRANIYYYELDEYEKAFNDYSSLIKTYDEYSDKNGYEGFQENLRTVAEISYLNRGWIYFFRHHDVRLAILDMGAAIKINDERQSSYVFRALFYFAGQNYEKSIQDLQKVLSLSDDMNVHQVIDETIALMSDKSSFSDDEKKKIVAKMIDVMGLIGDKQSQNFIP